MKVYSVATHSQGYYSEYLESAKKHNIDLIILGFGQKWGGFIWRFKLLIDALKKLNKNEIVMFTDAYDVIFLTSNEEIEKKFKSFNTRILVGITKNKNRYNQYYCNLRANTFFCVSKILVQLFDRA